MTKVIEKNDIRGRRRQAILTAAAEEFWQSGFEHARMDAIAARAGIGKSTIYECGRGTDGRPRGRRDRPYPQ